MIEIKSEIHTWYIKDVDAAYKIAFFLDSRGIDYDSTVILCHPEIVHYSAITLTSN